MIVFQKITTLMSDRMRDLVSSPLGFRVFKAIIFGVGGAVLSRIIIMLSQIIIARMLGKQEYGQFSLINNTVNMFVLFAGMGLGATLLRYTAIYYKEQKEKASQFITTLTTVCLCLASLISLFVFILSSSLSNWLIGNDTMTVLFQITSITVLLSALAEIGRSILQGMEKYRLIAIIQIVSGFLGLPILFMMSKSFNIKNAIIWFLLLQLIGFLMIIVVLVKELFKQKIKFSIKWNSELLEVITSFTVPAFVSSFFVIPVMWYANSLLARHIGFEEVAIFAVSFQWLNILTYIPSQLGQVKPIYTDLHAKRKFLDLKNLILKMTKSSLVLVIPAAAFLIIMSKHILLFYGKVYVDGQNVFILMIITALFIAMQSQIGAVLQAIGKMWQGLMLNIIWAFNLIVLLYLLLDYGALGFSIAYMISYIIHAFLSIVILSKIFKMEKKNEVYR